MIEDVQITIVSSDQDYSDAMSVRRKVFVDENHIPAEHEFDGNDHSSTHVLARHKDKPVGTMRIRYFNGFVKFERMCVLPPYRKSDISEQIMQAGMSFAAQKGYEKVYGICKQELLSRWKKDGFEEIPGAAPTHQNGMTLIPICCSLPPAENVLTMQTPPEILNAREGQWDQARQSASNRLENNQAVSRLQEMLRHVRMIKHPQPEKVSARPPFKDDSHVKITLER